MSLEYKLKADKIHWDSCLYLIFLEFDWANYFLPQTYFVSIFGFRLTQIVQLDSFAKVKNVLKPLIHVCQTHVVQMQSAQDRV
jgi:hypothetical protein